MTIDTSYAAEFGSHLKCRDVHDVHAHVERTLNPCMAGAQAPALSSHSQAMQSIYKLNKLDTSI